MYIIHLKGGAGMIEVSTEKGKEIKQLLSDKMKHSSFIEINDRMFQLSSVKAVIPSADARSDREPEPKWVPLTEEQESKRAEIMARIRKDLEDKGVLKAGGNKIYSKDVVWHPLCQNCGERNPAGMARVCSSKCYLEKPLAVV